MDAEGPNILEKIDWRSQACRKIMGFVNGLQGGSKVKSLSHSLKTVRADKYVLVTKNADCRMKQSWVLICEPFMSLCLSFHICKMGIMRVPTPEIVVRSKDVDGGEGASEAHSSVPDTPHIDCCCAAAVVVTMKLPWL